MRIFARKFPGIGCSARRRTVEITGNRDRRHSDNRSFEKFVFEVVVSRLAFSQAQSPAVIMDHDVDVIGVVEGLRSSIESGIVEVPFRRDNLPDELVEIVPVLAVAEAAAFDRKIVLVPPRQLSLRRQRLQIRLEISDQITAHRDEGLAPLGPQGSDDVGRTRTPIKTADDRLLDFERIHESDDVERDHRLLAIAERFA